MSGSSPFGPFAQVNTAIPLSAGQNVKPPPNLLEMAGQQQTLMGNALQQQVVGQGLASQQAIGRAYQAATDPITGQVDQNKFRALVAGDPAAALGAQAAGGTSLGQQQDAYKVGAADLSQSVSRAGVFGSALAPLLAQGDSVAPEDVYSTVARLHAAGVPVDGAVAQIATTMPHTAGPALHQWILGVTGAGMEPGTFLPKPGFVPTGGAQTGVDTNPITNPGVTSTSLPMTMTPGEQATPVPGPVLPGGGRTSIPLGQYAAGHGMSGLIPGTGRVPSALIGPGGAPAAAPGTDPNMPPGQRSPGFPPQGTPDAAPVRAPTAAPAASMPAPDGGGPGYGAPTQTSLGPGQEAGLTAAGNASAGQWSDLQRQVGGSSAGGGSAGRIYTLQKSLNLLQQLGPQGTGPGAAGAQSIIRYAQSMPIIGGLVSGITNPQDISNYDEANKYLTAYAAARAGAHGGTTDSQLATTLSSNASLHISGLAAQDVVKANLGLERMDQAQAQAFAQTGQTPDQFSTFSAQWNRSMDPRAFIADQLSPGQVTSMVKGMSPAEQAKFRSTYSSAVQNGWMSPPAWAQPQPSAPAPGTPSAPAGASVPTGD